MSASRLRNLPPPLRQWDRGLRQWRARSGPGGTNGNPGNGGYPNPTLGMISKYVGPIRFQRVQVQSRPSQ